MVGFVFVLLAGHYSRITCVFDGLVKATEGEVCGDREPYDAKIKWEEVHTQTLVTEKMMETSNAYKIRALAIWQNSAWYCFTIHSPMST